MAQKQEFTLEELNKINKPELIQLAESLHIKAQNLSKSQIIKYILGQRPSITTDQQVVQEFDTVEVFEDPSEVIKETKFTTSMPTVAQSQVLSDSQCLKHSSDTTSSLKVQKWKTVKQNVRNEKKSVNYKYCSLSMISSHHQLK